MVRILFKIAEFAAFLGASLWFGGLAMDAGKDLINGEVGATKTE